jgi:photosystem II stability/assembly factor-like uncharacterized protein
MRIVALLVLSLFVATFDDPKTTSPGKVVRANKPVEKQGSILIQSPDGGKTWQDIFVKLPEKAQITSAFAQGEDIFLGGQKGDLYHSHISGTGFWQQDDVDGAKLNELVTGFYPGHAAPYVSIYKDGFYRRIPGTKRWYPMHKSLTDKTVNAVLESPGGTIFVGCPSGIYTSKDNGKSWKHVFTQGWTSSLAIVDGVVVGSSSQGLLRSTDDGESWNCVLADEGGVYHINAVMGRFAAVRVAGPWRSNADDMPQRTSTSADGGKTWQRMYSLSPVQNWLISDQRMSTVYAIYDLKQVGKYLFCSHRAGISRSENAGESWELVYPATNISEPMQIRLFVLGKTVYAVKVALIGC